MGRPEFDITIGKDGKVRLKISGARGEECMKLADLVREIVGREDSRQKTADYYADDGKVRTTGQVRPRINGS